MGPIGCPEMSVNTTDIRWVTTQNEDLIYTVAEALNLAYRHVAPHVLLTFINTLENAKLKVKLG